MDLPTTPADAASTGLAMQNGYHSAYSDWTKSIVDEIQDEYNENLASYTAACGFYNGGDAAVGVAAAEVAAAQGVFRNGLIHLDPYNLPPEFLYKADPALPVALDIYGIPYSTPSQAQIAALLAPFNLNAVMALSPWGSTIADQLQGPAGMLASECAPALQALESQASPSQPAQPIPSVSTNWAPYALGALAIGGFVAANLLGVGELAEGAALVGGAIRLGRRLWDYCLRAERLSRSRSTQAIQIAVSRSMGTTNQVIIMAYPIIHLFLASLLPPKRNPMIYLNIRLL
jgi:hypothetical protein